MFKKSALVLFLALTFCISAFAQEEAVPTPNRWHGLIIDQSTPEDAIKALGQAVSDKNETFRPYPFEKRISTKGKTFRQLKFKEIKGLDSTAGAGGIRPPEARRKQPTSTRLRLLGFQASGLE